jgi:hypothetical protein
MRDFRFSVGGWVSEQKRAPTAPVGASAMLVARDDSPHGLCGLIQSNNDLHFGAAIMPRAAHG